MTVTENFDHIIETFVSPESLKQADISRVGTLPNLFKNLLALHVYADE